VTGLHPVTDTDEQSDNDRIPMFPALARMERRPELQPRHYDREPYWRAPITPPSRDCYVPHWNWHWHGAADLEHDQLLTLDANGAYMAALSGIKIAHSHLTRQGPINWPITPAEVQPGYYQIQVPHWNLSGTIVSPLGDSAHLEVESLIWIAHPTLVLLLELQEQGVLGGVVIEDSWTARVTTNFLKWAGHLRQVRVELLDTIEQANTDPAKDMALAMYDAFKEGYSAALSMMLTGEKCKTQRPDWSHAVYAQHAATMWRKGWKWTGTGHPLISMGHTDELTVIAEDLPEVMSRPRPPFRFDPSGRTLGAMKPKKVTEDDKARRPQRADALPTHTEGEDIL
jgi:hypothetical protein